MRGDPMSQTSLRSWSNNEGWFDAAYPEIDHCSLVTEIELQSRPAGVHVPLKGHGAVLNKIFAIHRAGKHDALLDLTNIYEQSVRQDLVPCLIEPEELSINLEVCKWCTLRKSCENQQGNQIHRIGISARSKYATRTGIRTDIKTLLEWFQNANYMHKNTNIGMIFSKEEDPFKPGFGRKNNRNLLLIPLNEVQDDGNSNLNHWAHVFYSDILGRSLSVSEAILIDYLPTTNADFSLSGKSYKTLGELKSFFETCDISEGLNFSTFSSKLNSSLVINIDESKEQNLLYNQLFQNLEEFGKSGLIGVVEHQFHKRSKAENTPFIISILWEFYQSLQTNKTMPDDCALIKLREHCILFSKNGNDLNIPSKYKVIRICNMNQLTHNWMLIDAEKMARVNGKNNNDKTRMPQQWLQQEPNPPKLLQDWLRYSPNFQQMGSKILPQFDLKRWNADRRDNHRLSNGTVLANWFSACEIFSAYAMNTQFLNLKNVSVTPGWDAKFSDLDALFRVLFFQHIEHDGQKERLKKMKADFYDPIHKRQHLTELLIHLGKQKEFRGLVDFQTDPDGTDYANNMETQELKFISPEKIFEETEQTVWVFRKQVWKEGELPNNLAIHDRWFEHKIEGKEVEMQFIRKRKLLEVLNWEPSQDLRQFTSSRSIWTSPKVSKIFTSDNTQSRELCEIIRSRMNQEGLDGVVFFAFDVELETIRELIGEENFVEIYRMNSSTIYCWNPHAPITDVSPNFLNVGKLEL